MTTVVAAVLLTAPLIAGAPAPNAVEPTRFIVGFDRLPRDLKPGESYKGGTVLETNGMLQTAVVRTDQPLTFRTRTLIEDNVRYVEEDRYVQWVQYTPNDPKFDQQYAPPQTETDDAWNTTLGDADATVCIADTGVRYTHEDLNATYAGGTDIVNNDGDPMDDNGHGTHVSGIAAGVTDNGVGIAGRSNVEFKMAKVLDSSGGGTLSDVAEGITWCANHGADVVSLSLGASSGSSTLKQAVDDAWAAGALVVAAAGNSGPCTDCVSFPAAYENASAITCTNSNEEQCSFSSQGPEAELAAPGRSILSTCYNSDTDYCNKDGTSMSTPAVAGIAGLVLSHNTSLTNSEIRTLLQDNAQDLGTSGRDNVYGYGEVDARATLTAANGSDGGGGGGGGGGTNQSTVLAEDFDDGTADGFSTSGLWHVSDVCETPPTTPNYLGYNEDSDCQYSTGAQTTGSATFSVDLSDATAATWTFQHKWETESYDSAAYDVMRVEVSTDGGSTWDTLKQWDSTDANQVDFGSASFALDSYTGGTVDLRYFFDSRDDISNDHPGWFVDDVEVTADVSDTNDAPTADAGPDRTVQDDDGSGDETVTLDGSGSSDSDGSIQSWEWTEGGSLIATGETANVTLATGTHTITLTVTDDDNATDDDTVNVTVDDNDAPTADFTSDCPDLNCTFDGSSSSDPDGSIDSYAWDFGDGTTGSGQTVSHTYSAEGTYNVTLTVTDNGGATDSATKQVTVSSGPDQVYFEDFDDGSAQGWEKSSLTNDLWRLADDCKTPFSGSWQIAFSRASPDCDYDVGTAEGWARSPPIDLSSYSSATLNFAHFWETESYDSAEYDLMEVEVSTDNGSSWTRLDHWDSTNANPSDWQTPSYDVSDFTSDQFRVRYRFDSKDSISNDFLGWYVDDVEITAS